MNDNEFSVPSLSDQLDHVPAGVTPADLADFQAWCDRVDASRADPTPEDFQWIDDMERRDHLDAVMRMMSDGELRQIIRWPEPWTNADEDPDDVYAVAVAELARRAAPRTAA